MGKSLSLATNPATPWGLKVVTVSMVISPEMTMTGVSFINFLTQYPDRVLTSGIRQVQIHQYQLDTALGDRGNGVLDQADGGHGVSPRFEHASNHFLVHLRIFDEQDGNHSYNMFTYRDVCSSS